MPKRIILKRRRSERRSRKAIVYDTQGLMALFEVETKEEVREALANMGITPHESPVVCSYQITRYEIARRAGAVRPEDTPYDSGGFRPCFA